jgi:hypothetical protein
VSFSLSALTGVGRTSYLVITAGRLVYKVLVVQGVQWAYSNIILKDGKLTFATTAAENAEIPANTEGLVFKWGSLIGLNTTGSNLSAFTPSSVSFIPSEYTGSKPISVYDDVPYASSASQLLSYDVAAGTGDICQYISDKGWVKGRWRLPTRAEAQQTIDAGYVMYGSFADEYGVTKTDGTVLMDSGIFFGTTDANTSYLTGGMPLGGMFLPSGGVYYQEVLDFRNRYARFWVSDLDSDNNNSYLVGSTALVPELQVHLPSLAPSVRCFRDSN